MACPASPPKYQADPIYTSKVCYIGTLNILELAKKKNARVLLTSTSEIYGEPQISPQIEKIIEQGGYVKKSKYKNLERIISDLENRLDKLEKN